MEAPKPKADQGTLLFDEEDGEAATKDPQLEQKINKYLQERASKEISIKKVHQGGEEHTGLTDDEADEEGEPDYDVASRMTLKASSEAFLEVMAEARLQYAREKEAVHKTQGKPAAKEGTKKS
ncbi:hypothetical protein VOLCADRAFT_127382 [Volvox carteri f. nagariensis]|uniref:Uncharacterized protein n=1 Tax=Volvox carteri f. nagariensis TaxID=3068 RepID=D8THL0_VOLCA|nr:uncharacterized protein VOLCADRAFT_127382 [Volvox carteri f. nagariensis]EFJ52730.1 hypothetical protein VOLCADRAFT_127382 [Volvox carteri f. nagariensis]|eukprot:XP_002945735.1 hypothetical protein VOLCADRAFT_127382 [Volvox carteri f. nagariensis]